MSAAAPSNGTKKSSINIARVNSKTAPARLEGFDEEEDEDNALFKVSKILSLTSCLSFAPSSVMHTIFVAPFQIK